MVADDHFVWFLLDVVDELDVSAFGANRRLGGVGRRGFNPRMLLALLIYAYAHGQRSSRRVEDLCSTDVAFRVVCAQDPPDHSTIARFRQDNTTAVGVVVRAGVGTGRAGRAGPGWGGRGRWHPDRGERPMPRTGAGRGWWSRSLRRWPRPSGPTRPRTTCSGSGRTRRGWTRSGLIRPLGGLGSRRRWPGPSRPRRRRRHRTGPWAAAAHDGVRQAEQQAAEVWAAAANSGTRLTSSNGLTPMPALGRDRRVDDPNRRSSRRGSATPKPGRRPPGAGSRRPKPGWPRPGPGWTRGPT